MSFSVIFDVDGLLVDTEPVSRESWQRAMATFGYPINDKFFLNFIGRTPNDDSLFLREVFGDQFPFDDVYSRRNDIYDELVKFHGFAVKPGAYTLLEFLTQQQIRIAVASSTPRFHSVDKLSSTHLIDFFEIHVFGDDIQHGKPAPDIFLAAAHGLGVPPSDCWVIEDSPAGVRGATAAGMQVIMVPDLIAPDSELKEMAYEILPDLFAVKAFFTGHLETLNNKSVSS